MMKKHTQPSFLTWALMPLFFALAACQQVPMPAETDGSSTTTTTFIENECEDCIKVCDDGTLDCYLDFEDDNIVDSVPSTELEATTLYDTCMGSCLIDEGCIDPFDAVNSCPAAQTACNEQCDIFEGIFDAFDTIAASDPIMIPQPSKVVLVTVSGCYDRGESNIAFQGSTLRTQKLATRGKYKTRLTHPHERVYIGQPVSDNVHCSPSRRGKISVKVEPWKDSTINVGGTVYDVIPFTDAIEDEMNLVWKRPQTAAFQLPTELSEQVDFSQTGWAPYVMPQPSTMSIFGVTLVDFMVNYSQYHNGTPTMGQGIMTIYGAGRERQEHEPSFTMAAFVRSRN
jgi:hypothetical protein